MAQGLQENGVSQGSRPTPVGGIPRRRPAVRWSNGQLAMALFLSTEAMFFGALVSSYFVLRWSVAHGNWPSHEAVHLDARIGWLNTVVLLASSWALSRTLASSRQQRPGAAKGWLCVAIGLATAFLGIKGFEYWEKYRAGVLSLPGENAVHEAPDVEYLARLKMYFDRLTEGEDAVDETNEAAEQLRVSGESGSSAQRRESLRMLRGALVRWPTRAVGRNGNDPVMNQWTIRSTAHLIAPLAAKAELATFLGEHQRDLEEQHRSIKQKLADGEQALAEVQRQMALAQGDAESTDAGGGAIRPAADLAAEAAMLTQQITELNLELGPLADRCSLLALMQDDWHRGVNQRFELRLPQVMSGGASWVNAYVMLTGCHALHVLGGIVALMCLVPVRLDSTWSGVLQNVGWYWLFVDVVWFVVFPLVYLL